MRQYGGTQNALLRFHCKNGYANAYIIYVVLFLFHPYLIFSLTSAIFTLHHYVT